MGLLPVTEALARVLEGAEPLPAEQVALMDAAGRVLAADLAARRTQPPEDVSAMDGYAVRADDVASAPARLRLIGEVAAGRPFAGSIAPGETARIFTGGVLPPGADTSNTNPNGGTNGAGLLDVRNVDVPANTSVSFQFDVTLDPTLADGTIVLNQADLISTVKIADSDDPNINGQADPDVVGDEDPTQVVVLTTPPEALRKENTQATAAIGVPFSYRCPAPVINTRSAGRRAGTSG